ncbi:MAG: Holliday junction DNA helicase RuvB C-terminal domain-containing protein, partial [Candidatus Moraniibacteriota bacterium]
PSARTIQLDLPKFTLIGATTRLGSSSNPLRNRFGSVHRLEFYTEEEITRILTRSSRILNIGIDPSGADRIAQASRHTPRVANRLLKRVRDYAQTRDVETITRDVAVEALGLLEIDHLGLEPTDRHILSTLIDKFSGGPVGVQTIAAATSEERETIEDVYEPFLIQLGLLTRTPRGRVATPEAYTHLGKTPPEEHAKKLL